MASLVVENPGTQETFYVERSRNGALITTSDSTFSWNGGTGDWFAAANWDNLSGSGGVPQPGDSIAIYGGTAMISESEAADQSFEAETITLAASAGAASAILQTGDATFGLDTVIQDGAANSTGTLLALGTTVFEGSMIASARSGSLKIDIDSDGAGAGFFNLDSAGSLIATQKGVLNITGNGTLDDEGIIEAQAAVDIAPGVSVVANTGTIQIMTGGMLTIGGSADAGITFSDATGTLVLDNLPAANSAYIYGFEQGNTIVLPNVIANRFSYDSRMLTLSDDSENVGTLSIQTADGEQHFNVRPSGSDGTTITYQQSDPLQELMLPTAVFAAPGQTVSLESILEAAFGTTLPYAAYGLSYMGQTALSGANWSYWDPNNPSVSAWAISGSEISPLTHIESSYSPFTETSTVSADAVSDVDYVGGNNIGPETFMKVPVTGDGRSPTDNIYYSIQTIDPSLESPTANGGIVNPSDIVASALRFAAYYDSPVNSNDCGFIAAAVAAAAGATMPEQAYSTDPDDNVSGGFWRVIYRGSDESNPTADWFNLVQPRDIVRMGYLGGGQHTTTILSKNADGTVTVYDNDDTPTNENYSVISIHDATYWENDIPSSITIYRLDPNHQYLITGGTKPQVIQGSVYNNLIQPGNGADTITAGGGNNEIQDTTTNLNGITVTDFHAGDCFDVTDLNSSLVNGIFLDTQTDKLSVGYTGNNAQPLQFQLSGNFTGQSFAAVSDGAAGATIRLTSGTIQTGAATIYGGQAFSNGLPVQTGDVFFHSGTAAVTVNGGSGNVTLFGSSGSSSSVFVGGSGGNVSLIGGSGTGTSTLVGATGTTQEFQTGPAIP